MKKKGTRKREEIIQAAIKCFAEQGIENTKLVGIAKAAGINHSLVLYHFKDFDTLCFELVESLVQEFFDYFYKVSFIHQSDFEKLLRSFISAHFILAKKNRDKYSIWLYFYYRASIDRRYKQLLSMIRLSMREKMILLFMPLCEQHQSKLDQTETEYLADHILSSISGHLILALTEEKRSLSNFQEQTFDQIRFFLVQFFKQKYRQQISLADQTLTNDTHHSEQSFP